MAYITSTARASLVDLLKGYLARMREARARREDYLRTVRELSALSDRDLADLGISRLTIEDLARQHAYGK